MLSLETQSCFEAVSRQFFSSGLGLGLVNWYLQDQHQDLLETSSSDK